MIERTVYLEVNVIALCKLLPEDLADSQFSDQLIHYASSIGGNYRAARRLKSRSEYIKEIAAIIADIEDLIYFLKLLGEIDSANEELIKYLLLESGEILWAVKNSIPARKRSSIKKLNRKAYVKN